ncbi:hypothetical protein BD310DRAFT_926803 [Dichomitus squalens]|uniref:Uncharacterized protein n=1 Tax=Dichomitus squalens TaxID=114155 RepID=A0A4V2K837_9APHY|nr:hypothetical protein BD310DRAFT_926803 [Dichomitus squalens]
MAAWFWDIYRFRRLSRLNEGSQPPLYATTERRVSVLSTPDTSPGAPLLSKVPTGSLRVLENSQPPTSPPSSPLRVDLALVPNRYQVSHPTTSDDLALDFRAVNGISPERRSTMTTVYTTTDTPSGPADSSLVLASHRNDIDTAQLVEPPSEGQQSPSVIRIVSRIHSPRASPVSATPAPSDYADTMSISSSTIPPSYHTDHSFPDLPSYPTTPLHPIDGLMQDPRAPPSAFTINRSRIQGPRSRTPSSSSRRNVRQSNPLPLLSTGQGDPFADGQQREDTRRPVVTRRHRQAVDGGVRLAGGTLDNHGVVGDEWDYHIDEIDTTALPDYGVNM